jgi:hypothetical protein
VCGLGRERNELYDLTRRAFVAPPETTRAGTCVGGLWLLRLDDAPSFGSWHLHDPGRGETAECAELRGCALVGLWDDEEVVAVRRTRQAGGSGPADDVFTFRPADRRSTPIRLPAELPASARRAVDRDGNAWQGTCLLEWRGTKLRSEHGMRDGRGRLWLAFTVRGMASGWSALLAVDPATRIASLVTAGWHEVVAFPDADSVLLLEGTSRARDRIVRLDYERGQRTVLFPRAGGVEER